MNKERRAFNFAKLPDNSSGKEISRSLSKYLIFPEKSLPLWLIFTKHF